MADQIYRASELGSCVRALVAARLGHEEVRKQAMVELLERSAGEGNLHEEAVKDQLRGMGWIIKREQEELTEQIIPGVYLQGHIDAVGREPAIAANDQLIEVKSKSTKQFALWMKHRFAAFPNHAYQTSAYMLMTGLPGLQITKRREDGLVDMFAVPKPLVSWEDIKKKILTAERYRRRGEYPPCDLDRQWGCPFFYLHDEVEIEEVEADEETNIAMGELIVSYLALKQAEDAGKEAEEIRKETISGAMVNLLGNADQMLVKVGSRKFRVTKKRSAGVRLDKAALIADLGEEVVKKYETPWEMFYPVVREVGE